MRISRSVLTGPQETTPMFSQASGSNFKKLFRPKRREATVVQGALTMKTFTRFLKDESGATAIEYGLIAACISVAIITIAQGVGGSLVSTFTKVKSGLDATGG